MSTQPGIPCLSQVLSELQQQGLDRLDAQLLLLHVLGLPDAQRGWLLAHDTDPLAPAQAALLAPLVQRRLAGEPLAYLTGHKEFFGLDLQVDARVLVPRADTETLVHWALEVLQDRQVPATPTPLLRAHPSTAQRPTSDGPVLLDLGTGSAAVALAVQSSRPDLHVHATDASAEALQVAQANAQRLHLAVTFSQGSWLAALPTAAPRFDCIVSNPPYIAEADAHLSALRFEPTRALISGRDGLDDLRQIITQAPAHLQPGGWLLLEHGYDQAQRVRALLRAAGFDPVQSRRDLAGIERCSGGMWPLTHV